eukprot:4712278-Karenia_brevis.AAC.1
MHCNINFTGLSSQEHITSISGNGTRDAPQFCKTAHQAYPIQKETTNVCVSTYGMSDTICNRYGYPELAMETGRYDMIFNDEKHNASDEKQMVLPSFLKPHVGVMVSLQDQAQTPPHIPSLFRKKKQEKKT